MYCFLPLLALSPVDWLSFTCIAALPYWRQNKPPVDKEVNEEDNVEFDCQADGIPRPHISWFIDGIPIESGT